MDKKKLFLLIGLLWVIIIFGFIFMKEYTLQTGEEVLLKIRPVDPHDLFRGDYVILRYDIGTLNLDSLTKDVTEFGKDENVYVALSKEDGYGAPTGIYKTQPKNKLFIKGTIKEISGTTAMMEYGIESYFVPEGRGLEIERHLGRGIDVKVSIDDFGNAVIKSLILEGKEVTFDSEKP